MVNFTRPGWQICRLEDAILLKRFDGCAIVSRVPPRHIEFPASQFGRRRAHGCDIFPLLGRKGTRTTPALLRSKAQGEAPPRCPSLNPRIPYGSHG
jgi:hypothetical protein